MQATFGLCLARTDWDAPKHRGLTWFKVPLHDARVTVRPVREINGGTDFCEEFLDGVPVGDDMVIGEVNAGWPIANTMLAFERRGGDDQMAVRGSGARRGLAPDLVALAVSRGTTGLGSVRQLIARAHINDFMQAQLTKRLAEAMMSGRADGAAASYIKLGVGILDPLRAAMAMEVAGRTGIGWPSSPAGAGSAGAGSAGAGSAGAGEQPGRTAALNFLNGRIYSIAGGSNQIQRNIISERLLGLPREPSVDADKPFREVLRDARAWGIT